MLFDIIITKEDMENPNGTCIIGHNIMISKNGAMTRVARVILMEKE